MKKCDNCKTLEKEIRRLVDGDLICPWCQFKNDSTDFHNHEEGQSIITNCIKCENQFVYNWNNVVEFQEIEKV